MLKAGASDWGSLPYMTMIFGFLGVGTLCFVLGFMAHRSRWYEAIRPYVLWLFRRTGGCSLAESLASRKPEVRELMQSIRMKSTLIRTTDDDCELWGTPRGFYWVPSVSDNLFHALAEFEIRAREYGQFRVRPGDIVVDCGANVGVFTAEALARGAQLVVAIEPVPRTVECLRRNFEAEIAAGRVVICSTGLWSEDGEREMFIHRESTYDSFIIARETYLDMPRRATFPVTTLDNLVRELNLSRVDFVKMDVEGAARYILRGARETLAKYRPRLAIATEELPDDNLVVPEIVKEAWPGYRSACGLCRLRSRFQIAPDLLFFY